MEDDVTNPVADNEVVQPEVAAEPEAEIEIEAEDGEPIDSVEDEIEVEREGKKYRIPKALEKELMLHADYTRKTQSIAEEKKALEAERVMHKQRIEAQEAFSQDFARLYSIEDNLGKYEKLDWNTLRQQDPNRANALFQEYVLLKDQRDRLGYDLTQRQQQRQLEEQQNRAKLVEQGRAELARRIPNWSESKANELVDYATKAFGFTRDEMSQIVDPRAVETLYWAKVGKELIEKQRATPKAQQPEPQPVPQVGSKRPAPTTDLYRIKDPEKWAQVRNKQEAEKRRRSR